MVIKRTKHYNFRRVLPVFGRHRAQCTNATTLVLSYSHNWSHFHRRLMIVFVSLYIRPIKKGTPLQMQLVKIERRRFVLVQLLSVVQKTRKRPSLGWKTNWTWYLISDSRSSAYAHTWAEIFQICHFLEVMVPIWPNIKQNMIRN